MSSSTTADPRRPAEARALPPVSRNAEPDAALLLGMCVALASIFFKARAPDLPWVAAVLSASGVARYSRRTTELSMLGYSVAFTAFAFANVYHPAFARTSFFEQPRGA